MPITPTGNMSLAVDAARDLVASSSTFQAWVSAANEAAAKARVYTVGRDGDGLAAFERPFALVSIPESYGHTVRHGGHAAGSLLLILEAEVDSDADSHEDAAYDFGNTVGAIVKEMIEESQAPGRLFVRSIDQTIPPSRSGKAEAVDYYQAAYLILYGLEGG